MHSANFDKVFLNKYIYINTVLAFGIGDGDWMQYVENIPITISRHGNMLLIVDHGYPMKQTSKVNRVAHSTICVFGSLVQH